jgi:hypothetical protein
MQRILAGVIEQLEPEFRVPFILRNIEELHPGDRRPDGNFPTGSEIPTSARASQTTREAQSLFSAFSSLPSDSRRAADQTPFLRVKEECCTGALWLQGHWNESRRGSSLFVTLNLKWSMSNLFGAGVLPKTRWD